MKAHSLEMNGSFLIEKIRKRNIWKYEDSGRMIFEKDTNLYWLGGVNDWIPFTLIDDIIKFDHFNVGFQSEFISANIIPCEFNGSINTLQESINNLITRSIGNNTDIVPNIITSSALSLDITASSFDLNSQIIDLISQGDLLLFCDSTSLVDSTSFINRSIHTGLIFNETILNNLNSDNISITDTTSSLQLSLDLLFVSEPNLGTIHDLKDFHGLICDSIIVDQYYLGTTGLKSSWNCINSNKLLFKNLPEVIPKPYDNFQEFLDSCGIDFKTCYPYIITDILIIDDIEDYQLIESSYFRNHLSTDPNLLYDLINNNVLRFYNGIWIDSDIQCCSMTNLVRNRIYIIPITNTIFFIDCDGNPLKLFDRKRL